MKGLFSFINSILAEILIIFLFVFSINNYIGNVETTIKSDGAGYYDYLPSIFIHKDFIRKDLPENVDSPLYKRIQDLDVYIPYYEFRVNKYPVGSAVLQLPFFLYTYLTNPFENTNGYQLPFQRTIFHAALFYLFLALIFFKKILKLYEINKYIIFCSQVILVLSTSLTNYANFEAAYSHVYSFFAITAFLYFVKSYFVRLNLRHVLWAGFFFGLILILRQINILILLFIPFLAGSNKKLKTGFQHLLKHPYVIITGLIVISVVFSIQSLAWYLQVGSPFIYSYQGEGFDFLHPKFFKMLFGFQTGLFIYSPVLLISLIGVFMMLYKRSYYLFINWFSFFVVITYIFSSWWAWDYGCSYGMRVYVDYLVCFFIPFALWLNGTGKIINAIVITLCFLTIPLNLIQTYQYKEYILHWFDMDQKKYWKIFLKTEDRFKGLIWKQETNDGDYTILSETQLGMFQIEKNRNELLFEVNSKDVVGFQEADIIQLSFESDFRETCDAKIFLTISENGTKNYKFWRQVYLLHYEVDGLNKWQVGKYDYRIKPLEKPNNGIMKAFIVTQNQELILKNVLVKFMKLD